MVLLVTYDLHNPGRDYDNVIATIKTANWAHPQGSVWLIDTNLDPSTWVGKLRAAGDVNDEYFISRLDHNWASRNMDAEVIQWLKSPDRAW